jgi:hypothetical protein
MPHSREHTGENTPRNALCAELEHARTDFHLLLSTIPEDAWNEKGVDSEWRVREEMWHITWGMAFMLDLIRNARRRIGLPKPPMCIADRMNVLYSRLRATHATRHSIASRYDRIHAAVLATLDTIGDDEWEIRVRVFGEEYSIAELFSGIAHHLDEHTARIRPLINNDCL